MSLVIFVTCLATAVTGYTVYHLNRASAILADRSNAYTQSHHRLNAARADRAPIFARLREAAVVLDEMKRQVEAAEVELDEILDRNRELQTKIDSY